MAARKLSYDSEREQLDAAKQKVEQTRRDMAELAEQIRWSKKTISESEKLLARLKRLIDSGS